MTRLIHVLPDRVANQIAAGEVVERPASVVKELVENALDARSTRVEIDLERGGKKSIRVSDNGLGMEREDSLLCFDRHATSKIDAVEDLRGIRTFGFRGEALPSIAAVSRFVLETRGEGGELGTRVRISGGTITAVEDTARQRGTTANVGNLFFNAPARSKFLKAVSAETRAVSDAVVSLALVHPGVSFRLTSDTRVLLDLPSVGDLTQRVAELWGADTAGTLLPVSLDVGGVKLRGLVQRPDAARPGLRRQHMFVNGRPFRDREITRAADRGYRTTIPSGVRPWLFLYLTVPGEDVDVNVHPAKAEVRFKNFEGVQEFVERAVHEALRGEQSAATFDTELTPPVLSVREPSTPPTGPKARSPQMAFFVPGPSKDADQQQVEEDGGEAAPSVPELSERTQLWQIHDMYILAETRDGLMIIDQHAAHERVLFERLMGQFEHEGVTGQRLLFPLTIQLTPSEYDHVQDVGGILKRAGFEVEGFGGNTVIVHAVPNPHPHFDAQRCFREMVDELTNGSELVRSAKNQHERIAMSFACKAAIKAGQRLRREEMEELIEGLFATELPFHDVHGRPTTVRLSRGELERKFGR